MKKRTVPIDTAVFRSALIPAVAVFAVLAALLGIFGVVLLFNPEFSRYLLADMVAGGITSSDALSTWTTINTAITILSFLCPVILSVGLIMIQKGCHVQGTGVLYTAAQWMVRILDVVGLLVLGILIWRVCRYLLSCLRINEGIYLLYTMLISEALMVVLVVFLFFKLRSFLNDVCDTAASMGYTLSSGKVDSVPFPGSAATGFLLLGILCAVLSVDRLFTLTIVEEYLHSYYKLLIAHHPGQILAAACLMANGCADFLLGIYLRRYKRLCDRVRMEAGKNKLGYKESMSDL